MHHSAKMGWVIDAMWCIDTLANLAIIGSWNFASFVPPSLSKLAMTRS